MLGRAFKHKRGKVDKTRVFSYSLVLIQAILIKCVGHKQHRHENWEICCQGEGGWCEITEDNGEEYDQSTSYICNHTHTHTYNMTL